MKKLFPIIAMLLFVTHAFAQERTVATPQTEALQMQDITWETNVGKDCFCCSDKVYNLPKPPPISGPSVLKCTEKATFTTLKCEGAVITWNVSPAISFTGQGTSSITLIPPFNAINYSISVVIKCGNKVVENKIAVQVQEDKKCVADFKVISITANSANNGYEVLAAPATSAGYTHFWQLLQVSSCSNGTVTGSSGGWNLFINANGSINSSNSAVSGGPTGYGYQYPGLGAGVCYQIVHYIYCCGQWKKQTSCFCTPTPSAKKIYKTGELEINSKLEDILEKDLPKELRAALREIKD